MTMAFFLIAQKVAKGRRNTASIRRWKGGGWPLSQIDIHGSLGRVQCVDAAAAAGAAGERAKGSIRVKIKLESKKKGKRKEERAKASSC